MTLSPHPAAHQFHACATHTTAPLGRNGFQIRATTKYSNLLTVTVPNQAKVDHTDEFCFGWSSATLAATPPVSLKIWNAYKWRAVVTEGDRENRDT